jgi:hypothetical protein
MPIDWKRGGRARLPSVLSDLDRSLSKPGRLRFEQALLPATTALAN